MLNLKTPFSVLRSPFSVLRSPFSVLRSLLIRRNLAIPAILLVFLSFAALLALTGCPTDGDSGGGSSLPKGIVMKTAITGDVELWIEGEDITINWGDGTPIEEFDGDYDEYFYHTYTDAKERTITITGDIIGLNCCNLELKSLDVRVAKDLKWLSCDNNNISKLDVSKNTALESLYCGNNPLLNPDVSKNIALEWLDCKNNALTSLNVSENTELYWIDCANNAMEADALNDLFESLVDRDELSYGEIFIGGNPGVADCNQSIATGKKWVFGW